MNIAPTTNIIEANRKAALPWSIILGELIDNAFDANASRIQIAFDAKRLTVEDDGAGCEQLELFFTMGKRQHKTTTRLGRYGIGAKDAIISAGNAVRVVSICRGVQRQAYCDWKKVERSGVWEIAEPTETHTDRPSGTVIVIDQLRTERLHRPDMMIKELSKTYTPAIRCGKQIIFRKSAGAKNEPVPEYKIPAFPDAESKIAELEIGGRKARVQLGLTPEGVKVQQMGLMVAFGFRVIASEVRIGFGDQPTPGLFGWVDLLDGWELTKNKDRIIGLDDLGPSIATAFADIIAKSRRRSNSILLRNMESKVNSILDRFSDEAKGRRKAKRVAVRETEGTVEPKATGQKHTRAKASQPGNTFDERSNNSRGVKFSFAPLGEDGPSWKIEDSSYAQILYLNSDNPVIKAEMNDVRRLSHHVVYAIVPHLVLSDRDLFSESESGRRTDEQRIAALTGRMLASLDTDETIKIAADSAA